jgi:hypothetical protein
MDYLAIFCMQFCGNKYISITILSQTSEGENQPNYNVVSTYL